MYGLFARIFVMYLTMEDGPMGLDQFVNARKFITVKDPNGDDTHIGLTELFKRRRAIVFRGTACFYTEDGCVAKFSWRSHKQQPVEAENLKKAMAKGAKGFARLIGSCEITSTAVLRNGLTFDEESQYILPYGVVAPESSNSSISDTKSIAVSLSPSYLLGNGIEASSKCGLGSMESTNESARTGKRFRKGGDKSLEEEKGGLKDCDSNTANRKDLDFYENRILSCIVVSPAGRALSDFRSIRELLTSLRDAIRAHRSLYEVAGILHGDISSNNIV